MARILGIDYGTKRIGIAVTDPMQIIASPLETIPAHQILHYLNTYTQNEQVEAIIVGWPLTLKGTASKITNLVKNFVRLLKRHFPNLPIKTYDERFTTTLAQHTLRNLGLNKKKRHKARLDAISAAIMLRSYLENHHFQPYTN